VALPMPRDRATGPGEGGRCTIAPFWSLFPGQRCNGWSGGGSSLRAGPTPNMARNAVLLWLRLVHRALVCADGQAAR
jgi:hypothetical protein